MPLRARGATFTGMPRVFGFQLQQRTQHQIDFLSRWTPESAWFFGVFLGDGNVYRGKKDHRVSVCGSLSTVTQWMDLFAPGKGFSEFKRSHGTYQGYVNSRQLVEYFEDRWGLVGPKCENLPWPEDLPSDLLVHFMRGLWDSDGSLSIYDRKAHGKQGNPEFKARFGLKDRQFVERVRTELEGALRLNRVKVSPEKGGWRASYAGEPAMRVADWIYGSGTRPVNEDRMEVHQRMCFIRSEVATYSCRCGSSTSYKDGLCRRCWWEDHGRETGSGTTCSECGKREVRARGLCLPCYKRARRSSTDRCES